MITEDYVSFEVAKLLKEKGFDEPCHCFYGMRDNQEKPHFFVSNGHNTKETIFSCDCLAPTLQMAMKWLREVCKQSINLWYDGDIWSSEIYRAVEKEFCLVGHFQSYEEACEAAIKYCLENLI